MARKKIYWHSINAEEAVSASGSSSESGLSKKEAEKRTEKYGLNELREAKRATVIDIFLRQFKSLVVVALLLAAALSFIMGEYLEVGVIAVVLLLNAGMGTFQEYNAEKAMAALKRMAAGGAKVLRGGHHYNIPAKEIVPGDIFFIETGDRVPADGRIIAEANLSINESMLTGESIPSDKEILPFPRDTQASDRRNMVYKDTIVTSGRGKVLVTATGMYTKIGRVAGILQETGEVETPLQKRLGGFMKTLGALTLVGVALVMFAGLFLLDFGLEETMHLAIVQAVSFIPEGLPIVVTVVLAVGVGAMAARKAIVRRLPAVETLGCLTVVCTDKTGTLTKNEMTVRRIYAGGRMVRVTGEGYGTDEGEFFENGRKIDVQKDRGILGIIKTAVLCNDSEIGMEEERISIIGDPTEGALLVVGRKADVGKTALGMEFPRLGEVQFTPEKKFMATFNRGGEGLFAHVKGAPETVLGMCSHAEIGGKKVKLTKQLKGEMLRANQELAGESLRVLGFASGKVHSAEESELEGMVFLGLAGMEDPLRPEAIDAVAACGRAGIKTIMITGDHKLTAMGIARKLGMVDDGTGAITGAELDALSDEEFEKVVEGITIYARTSSEHKMRVVEALRKKGHVVAMTGDGVNDALAVKAADVGLAMGKAGTEVTKESSDMVILDDNFSTIVGAIEEGRAVYMNIKKVVSYLLATNLGEVLILLAILFSGFFFPEALPLAILPIHVLWVNLVTDGVCDVALAMEPKEKGIMKRKPRNPKERLITGEMISFILLSAVVIAAGTLFVFYYEYGLGDLGHARTMAFTTLAFFQLFSVLNARSGRSLFEVGVFTNPYVIGAILLSVLLQLMVIYVPFMNEAMKTTPLSLDDWWIIIGTTFSILVVFEIKKFIGRFREGKAVS